MANTYGPVEAVYKTTFTANVELAVQQRQAKIVPATTPISNLSGKEMQVVDLMGSSQALIDQPHSTVTGHIPSKHHGIYVKPRRITWPRTVPAETNIKALVDYNSKHVQEGAAAVQRARDQIIADAAFGNRLIKIDEDTPAAAVAFDTSRILAVNYGAGSNTGLTVKKIAGAIAMLQKANVDIDMEELVILHSAAQQESLYGELQVTSMDYRSKAVFEEKRVLSFMGCQLIVYNGLPVTAALGGVRTCLLYARSGLHFGDAMPLTVNIDRDPGKQYQIQIFHENWVGATRSEDEKFVQILCQE